jgi:hypothetical protein
MPLALTAVAGAKPKVMFRNFFKYKKKIHFGDNEYPLEMDTLSSFFPGMNNKSSGIKRLTPVQYGLKANYRQLKKRRDDRHAYRL